MVYLVIIVAVAALGIGRLWLIQRRHATSLQTVDGFRSSLERLSGQQTLPGEAGPQTLPGEAGQQTLPGEAGPRSTTRPEALSERGSSERVVSDPYLEPLDPERRAAAKRRLEARQRGALRSSDLRR